MCYFCGRCQALSLIVPALCIAKPGSDEKQVTKHMNIDIKRSAVFHTFTYSAVIFFKRRKIRRRRTCRAARIEDRCEVEHLAID
jgi:hypothetical protein